VRGEPFFFFKKNDRERGAPERERKRERSRDTDPGYFITRLPEKSIYYIFIHFMRYHIFYNLSQVSITTGLRTLRNH
jgi:hypothetical protein